MRAGAASMHMRDSVNLNRRRATVRQFRQEIAAMPAPIVHSNGAELELQNSPIEPSWILAGDPKTRARELSRSEDNIALTWTWDCTAGEFRWYFDMDETVQILEGAVTVTDADGRVYDLKTGDSAYFPAGHWTVWKVEILRAQGRLLPRADAEPRDPLRPRPLKDNMTIMSGGFGLCGIPETCCRTPSAIPA
jgi:uncharacterized cupin superfamily protein